MHLLYCISIHQGNIQTIFSFLESLAHQVEDGIFSFPAEFQKLVYNCFDTFKKSQVMLMPVDRVTAWCQCTKRYIRTNKYYYIQISKALFVFIGGMAIMTSMSFLTHKYISNFGVNNVYNNINGQC